MEELGAAVAI
jgi:hypothetical protein